jgi:hypothetical protein
MLHLNLILEIKPIHADYARIAYRLLVYLTISSISVALPGLSMIFDPLLAAFATAVFIKLPPIR